MTLEPDYLQIEVQSEKYNQTLAFIRIFEVLLSVIQLNMLIFKKTVLADFFIILTMDQFIFWILLPACLLSQLFAYFGIFVFPKLYQCCQKNQRVAAVADELEAQGVGDESDAITYKKDDSVAPAMTLQNVEN